MNTSADAQGKLEVSPATWHLLRRHLERDAVIVVKAEMDLENVAKEIARDNSAVVATWIEEGSLTKPSLEQIEEWNLDPTREFQCAIVQPYVLMQLP
jgi:hypothetical protein